MSPIKINYLKMIQNVGRLRTYKYILYIFLVLIYQPYVSNSGKRKPILNIFFASGTAGGS